MLHPPEGCRLVSFEPLTQWVIEMAGPETSPAPRPLYAGQVFRLRITFNDRYPMDPPEVIFLAPVPIHKHIYSIGHICADLLYSTGHGAWSPALTMSKVALTLRSMLASATTLEKPPGDAEYCSRARGKSPKDTRWEFDDDRV